MEIDMYSNVRMKETYKVAKPINQPTDQAPILFTREGDTSKL